MASILKDLPEGLNLGEFFCGKVVAGNVFSGYTKCGQKFYHYSFRLCYTYFIYNSVYIQLKREGDYYVSCLEA